MISSVHLPEVPINIKDPDTDRLARELARATGERITDAVRIAIEERLARTLAPSLDAVEVMRRARAELATLPVLDARPLDELVEYDDDGLPI
jgi:antitoxin VapB